MSLLRDTVPFVEIHPTARCNLACRWCTYLGSDHSQQLRLADLSCLEELKPEEILLAGGGEPTLFDEDGCGFDGLVRRIRQVAPCARLRMITNGVVIPSGSWWREVDEVSISLDAADAEAYAKCKGKDAFEDVLDNIFAYLDGPGVPGVRVTYLYSRNRLNGALALAELLWRVWNFRKGTGDFPTGKATGFTFMVFPLANDASPDQPYWAAELTDSDKRRWRTRMADLRRRPSFWRFVRDHTNLATRPLEPLIAPPAKRCLSVSHYLLLGADRRFHACFRMCARRPERNLGLADQGARALLRRREAHMLNPPADCGRGCRPCATFYGLRSARRFADDFRTDVLARWDGMVDRPLAAHVQHLSVKDSTGEAEAPTASGIVWFGNQIWYKVLRTSSTSECPGPALPGTGDLTVQYNVSRGWPRGPQDKWKAVKTADGQRDCPFCGISPDFVLADIERPFGAPFRLIADSRPFFTHHMLAVAKTHTGGVSFSGFEDLVWLLNSVFPAMKAIIGTGNQADHLHAHIFEGTLPIECWRSRRIGRIGQATIHRLLNGLGLTYFVVECSDLRQLAKSAYTLSRQIEGRGLIACVLLSAGKVYVVPQTGKTIGRRFEYPSVFNAFKDVPNRPQTLRPRFMGPIEMAGVFLCYARGDVPAMQRMYDAMDLPTFRHMLLETGLPWSSNAARRLAEGCCVTSNDARGMISTLSPEASDCEIVGGKVAGIHTLHELHHDRPEPASGAELACGSDPIVPEGLVIPTSRFEQIVVDNLLVRPLLEALSALNEQDRSSDAAPQSSLHERISGVCRSLREVVRAVHIPAEMAKSLRRALQALGGRLAVRSSASIEDQATNSGAGLARSVLDVHTPDALQAAVRAVWASLYSDGFVQLCRRTGQDIANARMAVLLQPMIRPLAAGVIMSLDARGRPVFSISACNGVGCQVVDGGSVDSWLVSPDAACILERRCQRSDHPCMDDPTVLLLARATRTVQQAWRSSGMANHVDIEFAIDNGGRIVLLQCRPLTAVPDRDGARVDVVDVRAMPTSVEELPLEGLCAFEGAAVGRLNVLRGRDESALRALIRRGDIVVTARTTCRWNTELDVLAGLITEEGNTVSHPAIHAREHRLPTVIGARGAMSALSRYQGQTVTLDSGTKRVYLGIVPIAKAARAETSWRPGGNGSVPETPINRPARSQAGQGLMTDFEGTWRPRPAIPYSPFQLDYYAKAFPWYAAWLRDLDWPSGGSKPTIGRHIIKVRRSILHVEESQDGPPDHHFMRSLSLADFDFLVERRWEVLDRLGPLYEDLTSLDVNNVEDVVRGLIELLGVNSMGYELRTAFAELYIDSQARYIAPACLAELMREAWPALRSPRPDLEAGRREELQELAASVASSAKTMAALVGQGNSAHRGMAVELLCEREPEIYARLVRLAEEYKQDSEDIRSQADPIAWVDLLVDRAKTEQAKLGGTHAPLPEDAARQNALYSSTSSWYKRAMPDYPTLQRTLAVARSEEVFRSNFHHLITRYQRKVAAAMLRVAAKHPGIFDHPEDVFEIGLEELVALIRNADPSFIRRTPERNRILSEADDALHELWSTDSHRAVSEFRQGVRMARSILHYQARATKWLPIKRYYRQMARTMSRRLKRLEAMADATDPRSSPKLTACVEAKQ